MKSLQKSPEILMQIHKAISNDFVINGLLKTQKKLIEKYPNPSFSIKINKELHQTPLQFPLETTLFPNEDISITSIPNNDLENKLKRISKEIEERIQYIYNACTS